MNRVLYQLSYAAKLITNSGIAEISFIIIYIVSLFVKPIPRIFPEFFGKTIRRGGFMKFGKYTLLFAIGGSAYVGLEYLWRGRSHISMFFAGGLCFLLLGKLNHTQPRLPLALRGCMGSIVITSVELLTGLIINRDYRVWDYLDMPMNFHGQICLPFSVLWIPLSLGAMGLYALSDRLLTRNRTAAPK